MKIILVLSLKTLKLNTISTLFLLIAAVSLEAQNKFIIAIYDSTTIQGFEQKAYFTAGNGKMFSVMEDGYDENRSPKSSYDFWSPAPIKTYTINGIPYENHTNTNFVGNKYEMTYSVIEFDSDEGTSFYNSLISFEKYDSAYIEFKKKYSVWDLNNKKQEKINLAPNSPKSITQQFLQVAKTGDIGKTKSLIASKKYLHELEKKDEITGKAIKLTELKSNDVDKFKKEIYELYSKLVNEKKSEKQPIAEFVDYSSATRAVVGFEINNKSSLYCIVVDKSKGQWKVIDLDDRLLIQLRGEDLELRKKFINKKTNLKFN